MGKFFDIEGRFFGGLTKIADFIILDILVLIFSIPIITIGPALSAGYYVALKEVKNEEGYVVKSFWKAFKQNFLQGFIIELITFGAAGLLLYDIYITYTWSHNEQSMVANLLFFVLLGFLVVVIATAIYVFPMLAQFQNKTIKLIINSVVMVMKHLPQTIIMVLINGFLAYITVTYPPFAIFSIGFSLYVNSYIMVRIFRIYTAPPKEKEDEKDNYHIDMY